MDLIKAFRERFGFSQTELALFLGTEVSKIKKNEQGKYKMTQQNLKVLQESALFYYQTIDSKEFYIDDDQSMSSELATVYKNQLDNIQESAKEMRKTLYAMQEERKPVLYQFNCIRRLIQDPGDIPKFRIKSLQFLLEIIERKLDRTNRDKRQKLELRIDIAVATAEVLKRHIRALKS
jgi:transcriptional regulator with XRE-family HTH domain